MPKKVRGMDPERWDRYSKGWVDEYTRDDGPWGCPWCPAWFGAFPALVFHIARQHTGTQDILIEVPLPDRLKV